MARWIARNSRLARSYHLRQGLFVLATFFFLFFLGLFCYLAERLFVLWHLAFLVVSFVFFLYGRLHAKTLRILWQGYRGERYVFRRLKALPKNYTVISNARVRGLDRTYEIDAIVFGPTEIFVMEIKNLRGSLLMKGKEAVLIKRARSGRSYEKKLEPFWPDLALRMQAVRQALRQGGQGNLRVSGLLVFAKDTTMQGTLSWVPPHDVKGAKVLWASHGDLDQWIQEQKRWAALPPGDIEMFLGRLPT